MSSPSLPSRLRPPQEREQLDLFRALPGDMAPRDAQDLMAYPFFSLAKSRRTAPIDFRSGNITIRVEGTQEHGIATIWDADILIWAASQIVEAKDAGLPTSRLMRATPYEILRFIGRGTGSRDYQRLKAALDRLQSTTVATSIRETTGRRLHRFSWINEWNELADTSGTPLGIELILSDWFYAGVVDAALVLTIDPTYFRLTGGIERWLYRLVRKHGGKQEYGWQFDFRYLHQKSGSTAKPYDFACDLRALVARQSLPGYVLGIERMPDDGTIADFPARAADGTGITPGKPVNSVVLSGVRGIVLSGVSLSCYQECQSAAKPRQYWSFPPSNLPNLNSLTFSREAPFRWTTAESQNQNQIRQRNRGQNQPRSARQKQPDLPSWRAAP
ncbi:plasmid replication initiation protein [Kerstersia gyiorum]|nr:plasmid replication initiation protein [Kerstersia gyiorum]